MLHQELLGYDVRTHITDFVASHDELSDDECTAINLEVWTFTYPEKAEAAIEAKLFEAQLNGAVGTETLYIPEFVDATSSHYKNLQNNIMQVMQQTGKTELAMDRFTPDGWIGPQNLSSWYPDSPELFACDAASLESVNWTKST